MRKYLTPHSFNAFTIQLPRSVVKESQTDILLPEESIDSAERILLNRFANFIRNNKDKAFDDLPVFNFLTVFYDVKMEAETNELFEFKLILNKGLNKSMWLRLKHTIFNQYNALIGFSEVLKEEEVFDDNNRLIIHRINKNAREMFQSTKLLMEYELVKDYGFELKTRLAQPFDYLSSYMLQSQYKTELAKIELILSAKEIIFVNIDHEFFKESLDLFFDAINGVVDFSNLRFQIDIDEFCLFRFEFDKDGIMDADLFGEIQTLHDFFDKGKNLINFSNRMFHFLFIRLIAEKLGGSFSLHENPLTKQTLFAEWIFPMIKSESPMGEISVPHPSIDADQKKSVISKEAEKYPAELRKEITRYFSIVNDTFVLDEWKTFADKLDIICVKYKVNSESSLKQIAKNIRQAVDSFDVMALRKLRENLKQISFSK